MAWVCGRSCRGMDAGGPCGRVRRCAHTTRTVSSVPSVRRATSSTRDPLNGHKLPAGQHPTRPRTTVPLYPQSNYTTLSRGLCFLESSDGPSTAYRVCVCTKCSGLFCAYSSRALLGVRTCLMYGRTSSKSARRAGALLCGPFASVLWGCL